MPPTTRLTRQLGAVSGRPTTVIAARLLGGVRARNLRLDLAWIAAVPGVRHHQRGLPWPGRQAGIGALVSLIDPRIGDDLFTRSDPGPGLAQIVVIARDGLRRVGGLHG